MKCWRKIKNKPFFIRLSNSEYWPMWAFYIPMWLYGPCLALKLKSPTFFTAANPGIITGGTGLESKYKTIQKIPEHLAPKTILARKTTPREVIQNKMAEKGISCPLICKPDVGYRGMLVKKIQDEPELQSYLRAYSIDFIIQELITAKEEFGVLYYRHPKSEKGKIASLTLKSSCM